MDVETQGRKYRVRQSRHKLETALLAKFPNKLISPATIADFLREKFRVRISSEKGPHWVYHKIDEAGFRDRPGGPIKEQYVHVFELIKEKSKIDPKKDFWIPWVKREHVVEFVIRIIETVGYFPSKREF
ncbi:MAG: hypothetical protein H6624_08145 [Bdellovibrionaceae bacterium]|nr:hypothetical protein [Pseudobdellovibrionaceae bacterium]